MSKSEHLKLDIELYAAGACDSQTKKRVESHIQDCPSCKEYLQNLCTCQEAFVVKRPFEAFYHAWLSRDNAWRGRAVRALAGPAMVPALVTAMILFVALPVSLVVYRMRMQANAVVYKGASLSFLVRRAGKIVQGHVRDRFFGGDELQILYTTAKSCYVALASVDTKGTISFYHPNSESKYCTIHTQAGADQTYPSSIVLDNTKGQELVIAILSPKPLETEKVKKWLAKLDSTAVGVQALDQAAKKNPVARNARVMTLMIRKG